jgi:hypothetical protein
MVTDVDLKARTVSVQWDGPSGVSIVKTCTVPAAVPLEEMRPL